jgi:hypothetical protein
MHTRSYILTPLLHDFLPSIFFIEYQRRSVDGRLDVEPKLFAAAVGFGREQQLGRLGK